ncbi:MAG: hypothetical protein HYS32_04140 [Candidatus Woesearchaeota archaeon]|nr:MAG: hypothetical protein HYS32_04140 [Candidatus Woesearchaeota archaeon]
MVGEREVLWRPPNKGGILHGAEASSVGTFVKRVVEVFGRIGYKPMRAYNTAVFDRNPVDVPARDRVHTIVEEGPFSPKFFITDMEDPRTQTEVLPQLVTDKDIAFFHTDRVARRERVSAEPLVQAIGSTKEMSLRRKMIEEVRNPNRDIEFWINFAKSLSREAPKIFRQVVSDSRDFRNGFVFLDFLDIDTPFVDSAELEPICRVNVLSQLERNKVPYLLLLNPNNYPYSSGRIRSLEF